MASIKLNKKFTENVKKLLSSGGAKVLKNAINAGVINAGMYAQGSAKKLAPVKTGTLREGIQLEKEITPSKAKVTVGVNGKTIPYAAIQEFGGVIVPKNKKVLANKSLGIIYGKKVTIPAKPYIRPTAREMKAGKFLEILTAEIARVIK